MASIGVHQVHAPSPALRAVEYEKSLTAAPSSGSVLPVDVAQLGVIIRDGGGVALAVIVWMELRMMRQSMALLAERLGR